MPLSGSVPASEVVVHNDFLGIGAVVEGLVVIQDTIRPVGDVLIRIFSLGLRKQRKLVSERNEMLQGRV